MDDSAPQISIIVPTRNESENIRPLLNQLGAALADYAFEVIFVDDSSDDTGAVLSKISESYLFPIRSIIRPVAQRNGLSGAVVDGMFTARGEWLCVMDADLQHPPQTIVTMWNQAQKTGADIVVGSRRGDLFGPYGLSRWRSLTSKGLTIMARMLFPRRLKNASDPLTGLFLLRRTAVDLQVLRPEGFKILLEILVRCPALQVSEVHFEFAPRHSGESKADVREGARFFRHLVTLRATANEHLGRFLVAAVVALVANGFLLAALINMGGISPLLATFLAAEIIWLLIFFALEFWVFSERGSAGRRRRFWGYFLLMQMAILLVQLPVFQVLYTVAGVNPLVSNGVAFVAVALFRYLLSEQWVWTRGGMVWQPQTYYYNLHSLVRIESQIPFRELAYFESEESPADVDLQIRIDRQGTPSLLPGGINYDDQLGRFGFGLSVLPNPFAQIVVSPLLGHSPDFLYHNVVEPVLRWRLARQGFALVKAACVAKDGHATLISAEQNLGPIVSELCLDYGFAFMADDLILIDATGTVFCYPKPVTIDRGMPVESSGTSRAAEKVALVGRRLVYTPAVRRLGLWLSGQDLPAATVNTYLQRFIPQPKLPLQSVSPDIEIEEIARVSAIVCAAAAASAASPAGAEVACLQQDAAVAGFQPHPLLAEKLRTWDGEDLVGKEQQIIRSATQAVPVRKVDVARDHWWLAVVPRPAKLAVNAGYPSVSRLDGRSVNHAADTGGES